MRFKKGDFVRVINPEHHLYNETGEVKYFDEDTIQYIIEFNNGRHFIYSYDIAKRLFFGEFKEVKIGQIKQMIDLALLWNDKEWFLELTNELKAEEVNV